MADHPDHDPVPAAAPASLPTAESASAPNPGAALHADVDADPDAHPDSGSAARGVVRSRVRWAALIVAASVGLAAWAWYGWMPDYRPSVAGGARYGVDVSNHQGVIDWERVAADGIEFAYLKATEGGDFVDKQFNRNWDGAAAAGLQRGAYHFFTLCRPGSEQAANFLRTVPRDPAALPPALDLELSGNCAERPGRTEVQREVGAFLDAVESATGQTAVLYLLDDFDELYDVPTDKQRPIWRRSIMFRPENDHWWLWQYTFRASVDGIDGGVDLNVMRRQHRSPT